MSETILVTSYLESALVNRIRAAWDGPVLYDETLVPKPRYAADHGGLPPVLDDAQSATWREMLRRAEICFDFDWWQPDRVRENSPGLKWVQGTSAGLAGYVKRAGLDRDEDIVLTTAAGSHAVPLAEFALTGVLYLVKGLPELLERQRRHHWQRYTTSALSGRRVTVVGLGAIGRHVAGVFAALGAKVVGLGRPGGSRPDLPGVTVDDTDALDQVLPASDVLILATPLTAQTTGLLDGPRLALLPEGAVVVNIARGPVLDQDALIGALGQGRLGGAVLDVTDPEPLPVDSPLWDLPNVLISPHSASTLANENEVIVDLFLDNLSRWRQGRPLRNVYQRERGY